MKSAAHANPFEILGIEDDDMCDANCNAEEMLADDMSEVMHQQKNTARQIKNCKEWEEACGDLLGECKGLEDCMVERDNDADEMKNELYHNKMIHCLDANESREERNESDQCADDCNKVVETYEQLVENMVEENYDETSDLCDELSVECDKVKSTREQREGRRNQLRYRS